jgi:predicted dehydrogenase
MEVKHVLYLLLPSNSILKAINNINVALIGFGYWGPNLARNLSEHPDFNLNIIVDIDQKCIQKAKKRYPFLTVTSDIKNVFLNEEIDAVVIAVPIQFHFQYAKLGLENGKHVLIEKTGSFSVEEFAELKILAEIKNLALMVDYTFVYNGAVRKLKELVNQSDFGKIKYIDSTRINLGIFRQSVNVIWDLASHDIAIINFLIGQLPTSVKAEGISHTSNGIENIAYLTLKYEEKQLLVHLNCSWSSPVKIRTMLVGGENKMIIYNDIEATDKIKIYESNLNLSDQSQHELLVDYRIGDIHIPKFDTTEPLYLLISDFHKSITQNQEPLSSSKFALDILIIIEAAQKSLRNNGEEISIFYS